MSVQTRRKVWDFRGAYKPPAVASRLGDWCSKVTGSGGSVLAVSGGSLDLAFDNTNEVANCCLYMGDILPFDFDGDLLRVEILCKLSASLAAAVSGYIGLASARNDTIASITNRAGFTFSGSNALSVDGTDGTNSQTGKATGFSLSTVYRRLVIDIQSSLLTQSPPSLSKGGAADVQFHMSNDKGALTRVCPSIGFNLSAWTGNAQLIAQIQKTSGTATGTLSILEVAAEYRLPV